MNTDQLTHNALHALLVIVALAILLMLSLKQADIADLQSRLYDYKAKYPTAAVTIDNPEGTRVVRVQSIDYGRHWIEISRTREVQCPPYVHQRHVGFDHGQVEPIMDKP